MGRSLFVNLLFDRRPTTEDRHHTVIGRPSFLAVIGLPSFLSVNHQSPSSISNYKPATVIGLPSLFSVVHIPQTNLAY
jgi:hypothetical protein